MIGDRASYRLRQPNDVADSAVKLSTAPATHGARPTVAEVDGLTVTFTRRGAPVRAVRGVDLTIARGEILGLVGESGSGKTVLGLSLLGLLPEGAEVSGRAAIVGTDMVGADERTRQSVRHDKLGAVFQDPMSSLNPTMRIGRQVGEVAGTEAETIRLLDACGVPDAHSRLRQYPHELSGGLRQRVMLAIALAGSPALVIADEPTTALDVTVQAQVLRLLRDVRDEFGCAIILVTHDLAVAASVADRVGVMYSGRLVEVGNAASVLANPAHPYTTALLSARIALRADRSRQLPMLGGDPPDPRVTVPGCAFAPRCPRAEEVCFQQRPLLEPTRHHSGESACHFDAEPVEQHSLVRLPWPPAVTSLTGASRLRDVHVAFRNNSTFRRRMGSDVLKGINLTVAAGESVALVGESGSGKSTLLRVLAGLQKPRSGTVDTPTVAPQMVFQDAGSSLTPWLSVGELLEDRVRSLPRKERLVRVHQVLSRLGLPVEVAAATPRQLSGGQLQRVALARAVIEPPHLLLCDEPISALDAALAATVLNLLGTLRRELGFAMVFVTHDLAAARLVADRIVVMTQGSLVEDGPADDIIFRPRHPYTKALLGAVPAGVGS